MMTNTMTAKVAVYWTSDGKRKRERPMETWQRTVARGIEERGWSRIYMETQASVRTQWMSMVGDFSLMCAMMIN